MIEKPLHLEPPRPPSIEQRAIIVNYHLPRWRPLKSIIAAVVLLIALMAIIPGWVQKWLWMRQVGYAGVFWTIWSGRWELFVAAFVVTLLYLGINLRLAQGNGAFRGQGVRQNGGLETGADVLEEIRRAADRNTRNEAHANGTALHTEMEAHSIWKKRT